MGRNPVFKGIEACILPTLFKIINGDFHLKNQRLPTVVTGAEYWHGKRLRFHLFILIILIYSPHGFC